MDTAALVSLVWGSANRAISFEEVSCRLQVPRELVEVGLIRAIASGAIQGRIDAEKEQLLVDAAAAPASPEYVHETLDGLKQIEARLDAELYDSTKAHKRSRSPF